MAVQPSEPWATGFRSYAGWVPNVRSHLSFSRIGAAPSADSFTMPISAGKSRVVLVHQDRASNDYPLWTWLAKKLDPQIRLRWFLDAETAATVLPVVKDGNFEVERDRQGMLIGSITLIPYQPDRERRAHLRDAVERLASELGTRRTLAGPAVIDLRERCRRHVEAMGWVVRLKFALMRTGECRVWYDQEVDGWDGKTHDRVAEQAYYFIKDVAHDHTHHDPSDDQITPLIRFDPASTEEGHEDEIAWRRETMWSLSREIERRNRDPGPVSQRQALGIIAYAEAFQNSLMSHVRDSATEKGFRKSVEIHDFDFSYLKDSVKASIDVITTKIGQRVQMSIAFTATLLSSFALISSLVSAHNGALPRGPGGIVVGGLRLEQFEPVLGELADHPVIWGIATAGFLLALIAMFLADGSAGLYNRAQRTVSQFGRAVVVTLGLRPRFQWYLLLAYHAGASIGAVFLIYGTLNLIAGGGVW